MPPVLSSKVKTRHIKMMFWGNTATRKTETILRHFPYVLLIDTEGNSDQCVDMPEIPEFIQLVTKDPEEALKYIEEAAVGKLKFPDGHLVETVAIDSVSVFWGLQKDVAAVLAEKRAEKWNKDTSAATSTQIDWVVAKRPMYRIYNKLTASPVKYIIFTAREKDAFDPDEDKNKKKKGEVVPDIMKGLDYNMNVVLHFMKDGQKWSAMVDKVQGGLREIFPIGKIITEIPYQELFAYAQRIVTSAQREDDDQEISNRMMENEQNKSSNNKPVENRQSKPANKPPAEDKQSKAANKPPVRTSKDLAAVAKEKGIAPGKAGEILKQAGYAEFKPENFEAMKKVLENAAKEKSNGGEPVAG